MPNQLQLLFDFQFKFPCAKIHTLQICQKNYLNVLFPNFKTKDKIKDHRHNIFFINICMILQQKVLSKNIQSFSQSFSLLIYSNSSQTISGTKLYNIIRYNTENTRIYNLYEYHMTIQIIKVVLYQRKKKRKIRCFKRSGTNKVSDYEFRLFLIGL